MTESYLVAVEDIDAFRRSNREAEEFLPLCVGGTRYSSLGRNARRRARNARWAWMASSGGRPLAEFL
jgi:hypothetical protein